MEAIHRHNSVQTKNKMFLVGNSTLLLNMKIEESFAIFSPSLLCNFMFFLGAVPSLLCNPRLDLRGKASLLRPWLSKKTAAGGVGGDGDCATLCEVG